MPAHIQSNVCTCIYAQALFFDDTYEHEVFNKTDEERVVLLFDLWHPELTADEIDAIDGMFAYAREQGWLSKTST